jgi:hypothetical protein
MGHTIKLYRLLNRLAKLYPVNNQCLFLLLGTPRSLLGLIFAGCLLLMHPLNLFSTQNILVIHSSQDTQLHWSKGDECYLVSLWILGFVSRYFL